MWLFAIQKTDDARVYFWNGLGWDSDLHAAALWSDRDRAVNYACIELSKAGKIADGLAVRRIEVRNRELMLAA